MLLRSHSLSASPLRTLAVRKQEAELQSEASDLRPKLSWPACLGLAFTPWPGEPSRTRRRSRHGAMLLRSMGDTIMFLKPHFVSELRGRCPRTPARGLPAPGPRYSGRR
eukprot:365325-Chlamydomonas_euryale.AAC.10